jgi:hypothetical protein
MCHIFFLFSTANKKIMSNESNVAKAPEATSATTAEGAAAATFTSIWTLETIVRNFDTIPGRLDQGKWLVVTAKISPAFRSLGGFKSLGEVLGGADLGAAALVVGPWLKKNTHVRLPVVSYSGLSAYEHNEQARDALLNPTLILFSSEPARDTPRATREAPGYQARTYPAAIPPGPPISPALLVERSW